MRGDDRYQVMMESVITIEIATPTITVTPLITIDHQGDMAADDTHPHHPHRGRVTAIAVTMTMNHLMGVVTITDPGLGSAIIITMDTITIIIDTGHDQIVIRRWSVGALGDAG